MNQRRKFRPSVDGLEQRLTLNGSFGHAVAVSGGVAQAAVLSPDAHHSGHTPHTHHGGHHSHTPHTHHGGHGGHKLAVVAMAHHGGHISHGGHTGHGGHYHH